jgi:broad specificity phosphatase PhoE
MTKIYLVRHGQDTDNAAGILNGWRDTELTDLGRSQAKKTALSLVGKGIEKIYSSPLRRAHETAEIIASAIGIDDIVSDDRLKERNLGILTGKPLTDILKYPGEILPTDQVNYILHIEDGEDFPNLLQRAKDVLEDIQKENTDKTVLIVAHGDIGKMIRAAFSGWPFEQGLKTLYFDNAEVIELI